MLGCTWFFRQLVKLCLFTQATISFSLLRSLLDNKMHNVAYFRTNNYAQHRTSATGITHIQRTGVTIALLKKRYRADFGKLMRTKDSLTIVLPSRAKSFFNAWHRDHEHLPAFILFYLFWREFWTTRLQSSCCEEVRSCALCIDRHIAKRYTVPMCFSLKRALNSQYYQLARFHANQSSQCELFAISNCWFVLSQANNSERVFS